MSLKGSALGAAVALLAMAGAAKADTLKFCFVDWAPYTGTKSDQAVGISISVGRAAAATAGFESTFDSLPWKRCLVSVDDGAHDVVIDTSVRDDGTKFVYPKNFSSLWTDAFWVRADATWKDYANLDQFRGAVFGLVTGYNYPNELRHNPRFDVDESQNDLSNMRKLKLSRVDVVVADVINGIEMLKANPDLAGIRYLTPAFTVKPLYFAFTAKRAEAMAKYDAGMAAILADGKVDSIYQEHTGKKFSVLKSELGWTGK